MHTIMRGLIYFICVGSVIGAFSPRFAAASSEAFGRVQEIKHTPTLVIVRLESEKGKGLWTGSCYESTVLGLPPPTTSSSEDLGYIGLPLNSPATPYWLSLLQIAQERHEAVKIEYDSDKSCTINAISFE